MMRLSLCVAATALLLAGCQPAAPLRTGSAAGDVDWANPGGDAGKTHFSPLTDINPGNVERLGLAWSYDLGTGRVQEATPVVIGGVMYTSSNLGRVYALDAATGAELWKFEPEVDMQVNRVVCCDQANRGVAVHDGKVFVGALDGMLYALDQKTGAVVWKADTVDDKKRGYSSTGAPEIAGDVVLLGNAGAEYDTRGYVTAYDVETGKQAWRFYTVPRDPKLGAQENPELEAAVKTWDPKSRWDIGGGGTAWDAIHYDPATDTVFVGTGNGGPYPAGVRSPERGDNLYLSSILALDPRTGRLKWHYQETPQDSWDFTAVQPMILTDLMVDGRQRPVILHAPKNGFLFVIDRLTGKPLRANPIVRVSWTSGYDLSTGRPKLTPETSDYVLGPKIVFPSTSGARNWHPGAYDPARGLFFGSVVDMGNLMFLNPGPLKKRGRALNVGSALVFTSDLIPALPTLPPPIQDEVRKLPQLDWVKQNPGTSELRAIDPLTGQTRWKVPLDGWQDRGGVLATASGLLFHGMLNGKLNIYDSGSGRLLKSIDTGTSILAGAMSYRIKGVQYVAVQVGWGGGGWSFVPDYAAAYRRSNAGRILVFKLDGGPVPLPEPLPPLTVAPEPPAQAKGVTAATIAAGQGIYFENCAICHSNQPRSISPDLRRMSADTHAAFWEIVHGGALVPAGMPRWDDILSEEDVDTVHAYLIDEQAKSRKRELQLQKEGKPLDQKSLAIMSSF